MRALRRLAYAALVVAYTHLVFGAIVRISGSGMGCGDNWPKCYGSWFPPMSRPDLIIEWTHRLLASILITVVAVLTLVAWRRRGEPGVAGRGGVLRVAVGALATAVGAAVLGAVTVFLGNAPYATAAHWTVAMTLLAVLATAAIRAGTPRLDPGRPASGEPPARRSTKVARLAFVAAALAFATVVMGGLTAKYPSASIACRTFPLCGADASAGVSAIAVQVGHRVLAYLVIAYLLVVAFALRARAASPVVVRAGRVALAISLAQFLVAGAMIGMRFPPVLRSLHEAVGVAVWLAAYVFAYLAARSISDERSRAPTVQAAIPLAPPAPRAPTMAVIVARGADIL